jgi:adenosine deaminase
MILDSSNPTFDATELIIYAKALFQNHEFLRELEFPLLGKRDQISWLPMRSFREVGTLSKAFCRGRFNEMRVLSPRATDEAIENRIRRLSQKFNGEYPSRPVSNNTSNKIITPLPELLYALAETFLCEGKDGSIRVRSQLIRLWQELILVVPPLLISSAWMAAQLQKDGDLFPAPDRQREVAQRMARWFCDTTLPVDDDPFLDYISETHGLDEVHMHLNGSTEAEKVWLDALKRPDKVVGNLLNSKFQDSGFQIPIGSGVTRLLCQEDNQLTPQVLRSRVNNAILLKANLLESVLIGGHEKTKVTEPKDNLPADVLYREVSHNICAMGAHQVPSRVVQEAWQLCHIFVYVSTHKAARDEGIALWHYALLRAQFCRLLVQQQDQYGFDQFQHITQNELREETESAYSERFRQIERGHQRGIDHLEGRFAPKATPDGTAARLSQILRGYLRFLNENEIGEPTQTCFTNNCNSLSKLVHEIGRIEGHLGPHFSKNSDIDMPHQSLRRLRFGLVAHFIKKQDTQERRQFFAGKLRPDCRDSRVRRETDQTARALVALMKRTPGLARVMRGIDAASNERHAAPEIFAPAFRRISAAGIKRITYHVGEDFAHIASGLRAMMEAVYFLDLGAGCRIGHGTAAGLDAVSWWSAVGRYVVMPVEDRLDDLVFARYMMLHCSVSVERLPLIDAEIRRLAEYIWRDPNVTVDGLTRAWRLRDLDPLARGNRTSDVEPRRRAEVRRLLKAKQDDPVAYEIFLKRHGVNACEGQLSRSREDLVIAEDADILNAELLAGIQKGVLHELWRKRIAIETLPSSNVRISIHDTYDDHHLQNWLTTGRDNTDLPVCFIIGSDDPGIFATSLRMEYAHVMQLLQKPSVLLESGERPDLTLEKLCLDAKRFRF